VATVGNTVLRFLSETLPAPFCKKELILIHNLKYDSIEFIDVEIFFVWSVS
jgi:hypothetical protein